MFLPVSPKGLKPRTMFGKTSAPSSLLEDPNFHSFKGSVEKTGICEKHETASK